MKIKEHFTALLLLLLLFGSNVLLSQGIQNFVSGDIYQTNYFIENKGHYNDAVGIKKIDFYTSSGSTEYQISSSGIQISLQKSVLREEEEEALGHLKNAKEREEEEEHRFEVIHQEIELHWLNTNLNPIIERAQKSTHYFSYGDATQLSYGYKKLTYKNIYNQIDLVYMIGEKGGIEYSLILHAGAKLADVQFEYVGDEIAVNVVSNGLLIKNKVEDLVEKDLKAFDASSEAIDIAYQIKDQVVSFVTKSKLDPSNTYTIDPWIGSISSLSGSNKGYDVDYDYAGNLYVYGGSSPFRVAKYSSTGVLLWTFLGTVASPPWTSAGMGSLVGNFVVNKENGKVYIGQGLEYPASLIRLRTDGVYDAFRIPMIGAQFEIWEMNYDCTSGNILNMGGSTDVFTSIGVIDTVTSTCVMNNLTGYAFTDQDILSSAFDPNGNLFVEMASVVDVRVNNHIMKVNSSYSSLIWRMPSGFSTFIEADNKPYAGGGTSNGFNALAANSHYLFYYDGLNLKAFNSTTGIGIGFPYALSGYSAKFQGGISTDECNNVFVGGIDGNLKVFSFDGVFFTPQPDIVFSGRAGRHVYDIRYNIQNDLLYVSGDGFVATAFSNYFCSDTGLHIHSGAICPVGAYVYVDEYDPSAYYTYIWTDTSTGTIIRTVDTVHARTDTLLGLTAGNFYTVTVIENSYCTLKKVVQFVTPTGTINDITLTLCPGDSIKIGSHVYKVTGNYADTFDVGVCDSIVNTHLTVSGFITYSQVITNCAGIYYSINGHTYTTSGTYRDTIDRPGSCDSIMITNLVLLAPLIYTEVHEICAGDTIRVGSSVYTTSGSYSDTIHISGRCDSILNTEISFSFSFEWRNSFTICRGDTAWVGPFSYTNAGFFRDTIDILGTNCDSFMVTRIILSTLSTASSSYSICSGDSVVFGSGIYYSAGVYRDTFHRSGVCDTAFTINVSVGSRDTNTIDVAACLFDTITYAGLRYWSDTIASIRIIRPGACDSFIILRLSFNPIPTKIENYTLCNGSLLSIRGKIFDTLGVFYDTVLTPAYCDTIYQYNVTRGFGIDYPVSIVLCNGDSVIIGNHTYFSTGVYLDTFVRPTGCDSIMISTVSVVLNSTSLLSRIICINDSLRVGIHIYRSTGIYFDTLTNLGGCDSFITTNLTVQALYTSSRSINTCDGDSIYYNGHVYFNAGIYSDTFRRSGFCDSVVTTTLSLLPISTFTQSISICDGDTLRINGHAYVSAGSYYDTLINYVSCDSILRTNLSLRPVASFTSSIIICNEDSLFADGIWRHESGLYTDTLTSSIACDSFYRIDLTVLPLLSTSRVINRCLGDSFSCGGAFQTITGIYYDTLVSSFTCDSILQTNLNFYLLTQGTFYKNICISDSFLCGGIYQQTSGTYTDTFINFRGCDSVLFTVLRVFNLPIVNASNDTTICFAKLASISVSSLSPCTYLWSNGSGLSSLNVSPMTSTIYTVTATDSLGCKSADNVTVTILPLPLVAINDTEICAGKTAILTASGGVHYLWNTADTTAYIIVSPLNSTNYTVSVTDINNCMNSASNLVTVSTFYVNIDAIPDSLINEGENVWLHAIYSFIETSILWSPAAGLSNTDSNYTLANPMVNTTYKVIITDANGCIAMDSINIIVIPKNIVLVPTGFSPNGDGVNDKLNVTLSPHLELESFKIYNRWGEEVFNYPKFSQGKGWDGIYKEREQPISSYIWMVQARNKITGAEVNRNGNVTLLR